MTTSTTSPHLKATVIGGGLAGSEAALQLADRDVQVTLYEMKPKKKSPAHHSLTLAEIVCSNSFGSLGDTTASGLLKQELDLLNCQLIALAHEMAVPAGKALAVDRDEFSQAVTDKVTAHPNINLVCEEITEIPTGDDIVILATGPLTTPALADAMSKLIERDRLFFFDAAAPIVTRDSVDMDIAFVQDRYGNQEGEASTEAGDSYINCPMNKDEYDALVQFMLVSEKSELKDFEKDTNFFEGCMPVEVIASRGPETLRFGPMKPKGLTDPRTDSMPYAVVQLRQDNSEGTLYNLVGFQTNIKWGDQKKMIHMIPGLAEADVVRLGVMHRNTYLHSPEVLEPTLQLKKHTNVFIAGQLTGTEGYTESIATGLLAAVNAFQLLNEKEPLVLPETTMLGSLTRYITRPEAIGKSFQPINSNWGILPSLPASMGLKRKKDKRERNLQYVKRSRASLTEKLPELGMAVPEIVQEPELTSV
jgi:methylenetetrahydrofolate--tRNA-(uracil-5-)-methyltransferase